MSERNPLHSRAERGFDHPTIGYGPRYEIGHGDALFVRVPLLDGAGSPHRRFRTLVTEEPRIERTVAGEGCRRIDAHAPAAFRNGAHERAPWRDLGRIHEWTALACDRPRRADLGGGGNGGKGDLRIIAGKEPPVEGDPRLVLHGVGGFRPGAHGGGRQRRSPEQWMFVCL